MLTVLFFYSLHYVVNLLAALVYFSGGLFYFDSWRIAHGKKKSVLAKSIGFFLLALESALFATPYATPPLVIITQLLTICGLFFILVSIIQESKTLQKKSKEVAVVLLLPTLSFALLPVSAFFYFLIAIAYFRDVQEKNRKLAGFGFLALSFHELVSATQFWARTTIPFWSQLLADYGLVWNVFHVLELLGVMLLGIWIWQQVRNRLQVQLFIATLTMTLVFFLTTTVLFVFFLSDSVEQHIFSDLQKNALTTVFLLKNFEEKTTTEATTIAENTAVQQAVNTNNKTALLQLASSYLIAQKNSTLVIASSSGNVLTRAEDNDRTNDTLSENRLFQKAMQGNSVAGVMYYNTLPTPQLTVEAAVPLVDDKTKKIIGIVITGFPLDTAFVDGVKKATGLDITIFGANKRVATTFFAEDGKTRAVGTLETTPIVVQTVLHQGKNFAGEESILNAPYFAAYVPLQTSDGKVIGMIFTGEPQSAFIATVKHALNMTFLGSIMLLIFSVIPAYFFTKFVNRTLQKKPIQ